MLAFECVATAGADHREVAVDTLVIAGWTGRDGDAIEHHVAELAALGVPRPSTTPCFYRISARLLTQAERIQVLGRSSSGEAEIVLVPLDDGLWIGIGSDHTDRALERSGVALSKQLCAKPVGTTLWRLDEVADHWEALRLRSRIAADGAARLYQEGSLAVLRTPEDLAARCGGLRPGAAMFCGTLPVLGEIGHADLFEIELEDPVLGRRMAHRYAIDALPVVS